MSKEQSQRKKWTESDYNFFEKFESKTLYRSEVNKHLYCLKNLKYMKTFSKLFEVLFEKRVPCSVFSGLGQVVWISKLKVKILLYWRVCECSSIHGGCELGAGLRTSSAISSYATRSLQNICISVNYSLRVKLNASATELSSGFG
jgi:hypothetical protein